MRLDDLHPPHGNVGEMGFDRRMMVLFVALAILGLPAFTLRVLCVGHACDDPAASTADVPFCGLPTQIRSGIAAGFREDRSADVLGVSSDVVIGGGTAFGRADPQPQWPSVETLPREVPLVFSGGGIGPQELTSEVGLDDLAPTVAKLMGIERRHPEVRSGRPIEAVNASTPAPLVLQVVWKGVGSRELRAAPEEWRELALLADAGVSTLDARVPSLPMDPAAVLTTIGTGGTPAQHGITGTIVRNDEGRVVEAWGPGSPVSVIAGLGDDLDELTAQRARVGLIAQARTDRGLIGKDWYVDTDRDDVTIATDRAKVLRTLRASLDDGYGRDTTPDLLAVSLSGDIADMDLITAEIVDEVRDVVPDAVVVVTATGSSVRAAELRGQAVAAQVDSKLGVEESVVEATAPGGLFLDQRVLAGKEISDDDIVNALSEVTVGASTTAFADVFPAIAVSFGRYC